MTSRPFCQERVARDEPWTAGYCDTQRYRFQGSELQPGAMVCAVTIGVTPAHLACPCAGEFPVNRVVGIAESIVFGGKALCGSRHRRWLDGSWSGLVRRDQSVHTEICRSLFVLTLALEHRCLNTLLLERGRSIGISLYSKRNQADRHHPSLCTHKGERALARYPHGTAPPFDPPRLSVAPGSAPSPPDGQRLGGSGDQ